MRVRLNKKLLILLLLAVYTTILQAQDDDCPALVEEALDLADNVCETTGTSELCYGHFVLEAEPQVGIEDFQFQEPGDIEPVTDVRSLRLSAMDTDASIWGVAVMRVRAVLTGQFDPEDVTFLLFGDVVVDNGVILAEVSALRDGNIRQTPSTASAVIGAVAAEDVLIADGRTADSAWLRIRLDDEHTAWVSSSLVEVTEAVETLAVADSTTNEEDLLYGAMQAFYFRSGKDDAPCSQAPNSGMLIQTPEGDAEVTLLMNEANIQLRATAYVQADPGEDMTVYVLDGEATVEVDGVERTLIPGTSLTVPLDEDGLAAGPPTEPEPYDQTQVQALPVEMLSRPVEVPEPVSQATNAPVSGEWNFNWLVQEAECPDGQVVTFSTENPLTTIQVDASGTSFNMLLTRYTRDVSGVYRTVFTDVNGNLHTYSVTFAAIDRLSGQAQIDYVFGCSLTVPFELRLIRPAGS
ncbi:MAG: SH3 domain-containing protein [Anaerolineae bacterium]|nr:SH3 domain-containing protein [Anaerolineae bacterium]